MAGNGWLVCGGGVVGGAIGQQRVIADFVILHSAGLGIRPPQQATYSIVKAILINIRLHAQIISAIENQLHALLVLYYPMPLCVKINNIKLGLQCHTRV